MKRLQGWVFMFALVGAAAMLLLTPGAQAEHGSESSDGEQPAIEGRREFDSLRYESRDDSASSFDEGSEASREHPDRARRMRERWQSATPEERHEMRRRRRERMRDANPEERELMRARRREWVHSLPPEEREAAIRTMRGRRLAGALEGLSPDERRQIRARLRALPREERREVIHGLRRLRELPADEREELRARMLELQELPDEERAALRERSRRWAKMSPEEKERLRGQMRRLKSMTPEEQLQVLERAMEP
jgi:hypothetical protein